MKFEYFDLGEILEIDESKDSEASHGPVYSLEKYNFQNQSTRHPGGVSFFKIQLWSFAAAAVDCLCILILCVTMLIGFRFSFNYSYSEIFKLLNEEPKFFAMIILGFLFLYLNLSRIFLGYSIGEGLMDLRLGNVQQRLSVLYPIKVFSRSLWIFATGIIVLPIFSLLFQKDVAGYIAGIFLFPKFKDQKNSLS